MLEGIEGAHAGAARRHPRRVRQCAAARVRRRHDGLNVRAAARSGDDRRRYRPSTAPSIPTISPPWGCACAPGACSPTATPHRATGAGREQVVRQSISRRGSGRPAADALSVPQGRVGDRRRRRGHEAGWPADGRVRRDRGRGAAGDVLVVPAVRRDAARHRLLPGARSAATLRAWCRPSARSFASRHRRSSWTR